MHHKRRRPKNARAGCLLCHPNKANGLGVAARTPIAALRQMQVGRGEASEFDPDYDGCDLFCRCMDDDVDLTVLDMLNARPVVRVSMAHALLRAFAA